MVRIVNGKPVRFATFCPKIILNEKGIEDAALDSRTIPIQMIQSGHPLEEFRFGELKKNFKAAKESISSFFKDHRDHIRSRYHSFAGADE